MLLRPASVEDWFYHACFPLSLIWAFALAGIGQPSLKEFACTVLQTESEVCKYFYNWGMRPPFDPFASSVWVPLTEPNQIVQPQGSCYRAQPFSHPASPSLLFHEQLMNADGALGDPVGLITGVRESALWAPLAPVRPRWNFQFHWRCPRVNKQRD